MYNENKEKPCAKRAEEDFTMTNKTLNQIAEMKKQTIEQVIIMLAILPNLFKGT